MPEFTRLLASLQGQLPADSCHSILLFAVPVILSLLVLNYLGQDTSPFQTHPKTMRFSTGCLLVYCFSYGIQLRFSSALDQTLAYYAKACGRCMEWSGCMLLASLASICFPDPVQWVFFVFYAISCMGGLLYTLLQMLWNWIHPTSTVAAGHLDLGAVQTGESILPQTSASGVDQGITISVK